MNKKTWMEQLDRTLSQEGMTREEKRAVLNYYDEMYQDKRDDGAREEDILKEFGFPEDVAQNVREEGGKRKENNYRFSRDYLPPARTVAENPPPYREPTRAASENLLPQIPISTREAEQPPVPNRPLGQEKEPRKKSSGCVLLVMSPLTLIAGFFGIILMIVIFATAIGLCVGGIGSIIGGFAAIIEEPAGAVVAFGTGVLIFGVGGLLFLGGVAFAKGWGRYMKWGLTGKGGRQ